MMGRITRTLQKHSKVDGMLKSIGDHKVILAVLTKKITETEDMLVEMQRRVIKIEESMEPLVAYHKGEPIDLAEGMVVATEEPK